jgi:hypothetical protein
MPRTTSSKSRDPEEQLRSFIEKFEPSHQAIIRAARKKLRKCFPTATSPIAARPFTPLGTARSRYLFADARGRIWQNCSL